MNFISSLDLFIYLSCNIDPNKFILSLKKAFSIFLLLLLIINLGAYKLWFSFKQNVADKEFRISLDMNNFNNNELVSISIPLNNAYQNDWADFERVDGEISFEGKIYKYVKQKVQSGHLVLLCIPDHNKMKFESCLSNIIKNTIDQQENNKKQNNSKSSLKILNFEYLSFDYIHNFKLTQIIQLFKPKLFEIGRLNSNFHFSPEQPPDTFIC